MRLKYKVQSSTKKVNIKLLRRKEVDNTWISTICAFVIARQGLKSWQFLSFSASKGMRGDINSNRMFL